MTACRMLVVLLLLAGSAFAQSPVSFSLEKRVPLTTSRVVGSPSPPLPYRSLEAFPRLKFDHPLYILAEPGTTRLLVAEQRGKILVFPNDPAIDKAETFLEIKDRDFYGFTFHPRYAENRQFLLFSNGPNSAEKKQNRISRFTVSKEAPFQCLPETEQVIIEYESNGHNGGDLAFGPDGYLYFSSGDGTSDSDTNLTGQKITDLTSGMIRIDVEHPAADKAYSIPADNPFLDIKDARPELWAYGFRNPWRIHFDPAGRLWCGDIGQDQYEMIELVERGDNYGWSIVEGGQPFYLERDRGPTPIKTPLIVHPHSEARSITGGVTYLGKKFSELHGAYVYGDYGTGKIWSARTDGKILTEHREIADTPFQMLGFGLDHSGEIYLVDYGGAVYTLERSPVEVNPPAFPTKLSETGLFASVQAHQVEPALIPYDVNSPLWSDGATKERFIALPDSTQIVFSDTGAWKFPERTVLVKTFSLPVRANGEEQSRRVETRLMVFQQNEWVGYSYAWNDEQTDADLVAAAGRDRTYTVSDAEAAGGMRDQTWHYPSRTECMVCHSRAAVYVLGVGTAQMNRDFHYGTATKNQLEALAALGIFKLSEKEPTKLPKEPKDLARLPDPKDASQPLEARVRSYLHANCAQCHVDAGGGNSAIELGFNTPREKTKLIDVRPLHNQFGIADSRLVAPGSPERSILHHRLAIRGRGQMPPLAATLVDHDAVKLIDQWIQEVSAAPPAK